MVTENIWDFFSVKICAKVGIEYWGLKKVLVIAFRLKYLQILIYRNRIKNILQLVEFSLNLQDTSALTEYFLNWKYDSEKINSACKNF